MSIELVSAVLCVCGLLFAVAEWIESNKDLRSGIRERASEDLLLAGRVHRNVVAIYIVMQIGWLFFSYVVIHWRSVFFTPIGTPGNIGSVSRMWGAVGLSGLSFYGRLVRQQLRRQARTHDRRSTDRLAG